MLIKIYLIMKKPLLDRFNLSKEKLYFSVLFFFLIIAYFNLNSGYIESSDSHRFSRWADSLIEFKFNVIDFYKIEKSDHRPHLFFFTVPVLLISLCKVIFLNYWQLAFLILNLVFIYFSIIYFTKSLLLIGVRPNLIFISLPLIVLSVDVLVWPKYILSDSSYAFLVFLANYFIVKSIYKDKFLYKKISFIIFLLLASRPTSIPIIYAILFFMMIYKLQIFSLHRNILLLIFFLFFSTPVILGIFYQLIDLNFNQIPKVDFLTTMVKKGMIIHDRPETWVDIPDSFSDIIYIYFLRFVNFFNPYAETFSIVHILLNVLQIFLIILSILIWFISGNIIKSYNKIFLFVIILSFSVAAFHSFTLIDYDWRYRFPIILPLLTLFPLSLEIYARKSLVK